MIIISLFEGQAKEAVTVIKAQVKQIEAELVSELKHKLEQKQASLIDEVKKTEENLIKVIRKNPRDWNRNTLRVNVTSGKIQLPSIYICFDTTPKPILTNIPRDNSSIQRRFDGPYNSRGEHSTGQIDKVYPNYELSFELKIDKIPILENKFTFLRMHHSVKYKDMLSVSLQRSKESTFSIQLRLVQLKYVQLTPLPFSYNNGASSRTITSEIINSAFMRQNYLKEIFFNAVLKPIKISDLYQDVLVRFILF